MRIFEISAIPFLMLCDYYLTLLGNSYRKKKYADHFLNETYELNPKWRKEVDQNKWFNYKFLVIVILTTAFLIFVSTEDPRGYNWLLGFYFILYGVINGRHLNNIFILRYLINHPTEISGKVYMSHQLSLKISQYSTFLYAIPVIILTIHNPDAFNIGGVSSFLVFFLKHLIWISKNK